MFKRGSYHMFKSIEKYYKIFKTRIRKTYFPSTGLSLNQIYENVYYSSYL